MQDGDRERDNCATLQHARRSRHDRRLVCLLLIVVGVFALSSTRALAMSQQGHVFGFSFGRSGDGAGEFNEAAGVAVSEASGDVYVVDRADDRVDHFGPRGKFLAAWGWGVRDGKAEFETCTSACEAGIPGTGKGEFDRPGAITVDNSTSSGDPSKGDVYVVADSRANTVTSSSSGRMGKCWPR